MASWARKAVATLAICLTGVPAQASIQFHPTGSQIDLLVVGYAVFQTNLTEDSRGFFDSSDALPPEFSNRQVLNLRMDGKLGGSTTLDARLLHDKENLRDWRWRMAIEGPKSLLALGENDGAFRDTQFTRYDTPYYGVDGRLGVGKFQSAAFATTRDASYRVDRLRGTNLSGPYILTASPVLEASERVAIEVRDRRDEERVLSSDAKERGLDYSIDYPTGTLQFREPIESETFEGNPLVIVIEYQYQIEGADETRYIGGTRLQYQPWKGLRLASTWLKSTGSGDTAIDNEGVVGFDQSVALGKWLTMDNEMAGPAGRPLDRREGAVRVGGVLKPVAGLEVAGYFRRVGKEFDTTANPRLDTELDREDWQLDTSFVVSREHRALGGYGVRSDNVADDPEAPSTRTRTWFAGWEARLPRWPALRLGYERRDTEGAGAFSGGQSTVDSLTFDGDGKVARLGFLGPSQYRFQYRYEDTHDGTEGTELGGSNRRSHFLKGRLDAKPSPILDVYGEWRETRTSGEGSSLIRSTTHEILGGAHLHVAKTIAAGASLRFRQNIDDIASAGDSTRTTALFDINWEPSRRLRALLKYELTLLESGASAESRTQNLYGHLMWKPVEALVVTLGSKLDDRGEESAVAGGLDGSWFASMLFKKEERLTIFARAEQGISEERLPPFEPTRARRLTFVLGSEVTLGKQWATMAEMKDERLSDAVEGHRRAIVLELSRGINKFLRLAGGVELTVEEQGDTSDLDRQRVYLKLVGRL